jgi:hypothetical protein
MSSVIREGEVECISEIPIKLNGSSIVDFNVEHVSISDDIRVWETIFMIMDIFNTFLSFVREVHYSKKECAYRSSLHTVPLIG